MSSMFDDILSRAEKLSSANFHATLADSAIAKKSGSGLFEGKAVQVCLCGTAGLTSLYCSFAGKSL